MNESSITSQRPNNLGETETGGTVEVEKQDTSIQAGSSGGRFGRVIGSAVVTVVSRNSRCRETRCNRGAVRANSCCIPDAWLRSHQRQRNWTASSHHEAETCNQESVFHWKEAELSNTPVYSNLRTYVRGQGTSINCTASAPTMPSVSLVPIVMTALLSAKKRKMPRLTNSLSMGGSIR